MPQAEQFYVCDASDMDRYLEYYQRFAKKMNIQGADFHDSSGTSSAVATSKSPS